MSYQHAEAFCLMTYRSDDGTEEVKIWNSRDGVTPFVTMLPSGKPATHINWAADRPNPDFQPEPGQLIFVDLTPEVAREKAIKRVDAWLAGADREMLLHTYGTRERAIEEQSQYPEGAPHLIEYSDPE